MLIISLPVPLLQSETDQAIEGLRPIFKMPDGTYGEMLMPVPYLMVRSLGNFSWFVLIVVLACFILSFSREPFARIETVRKLALFQSAYSIFYAIAVIQIF